MTMFVANQLTPAETLSEVLNLKGYGKYVFEFYAGRRRLVRDAIQRTIDSPTWCGNPRIRA